MYDIIADVDKYKVSHFPFFINFLYNLTFFLGIRPLVHRFKSSNAFGGDSIQSSNGHRFSTFDGTIHLNCDPIETSNSQGKSTDQSETSRRSFQLTPPLSLFSVRMHGRKAIQSFGHRLADQSDVASYGKSVQAPIFCKFSFLALCLILTFDL